MEYKLIKGKNSNYEIKLTVGDEELFSFKQDALKMFQKDLDLRGFRKGHVPLNLVEQNIKPEYLKMGILEEVIHKGLHKIFDENKDIKFIGHMYDLSEKEGEGKTTFTFKLDVYPEVEVKNDNWKTLKVDKVNDKVTNKEVDETILNLRRQYAEYVDSDVIIDDGIIFKADVEILDKEGNKLHTTKLYMGDEDFVGFEKFKENFVGKKVGDKVLVTYKEKELPDFVKFKGETKASKIKFNITQIKKQVLPELNEENIKKFFGDQVKNMEELTSMIKDTMKQQKKEFAIIKALDKYLEDCKSSLEVFIPNTILHEEIKARLDQMKKRIGGEDAFKKYTTSLGEEKTKEMMEQISDGAKKSVEKFFLFRKIAELLGIESQIDWSKNLDAENKIYEKLTKVGES